MIPKDTEAEILRLHHAEKWPIGTIAAQLGVHHETVERVLRQEGVPTPRIVRRSALDPFVPFIVETWRKYPRLTASRLHRMCAERGYPGRPDHFRHMVRRYRPQPVAEAYLRLKTLPGEQAQVDWAHFGRHTIGRAVRAIMAFVMVLSSSRAVFVRFFFGHRMDCFLRGHQEAFEFFGGVPRILLYDNLKSAVLERVGDAIRFHPTLLDFAGRHRFEPRPVAPRRGNEKGRVERAIRYLRSSFFEARSWIDLEDLNVQARAWCTTESLDRPWPEDPTRTVREAFDEERGKLLPLPDAPYPVDERREVKIGKTPYARFDGNDYSVPHQLVRKILTVVACEKLVRIFDGLDEVARHPRSYDRRTQVEDPRHIAELAAAKNQAKEARGLDRLSHAAPSCRRLLEGIAARGGNLGTATAQLLRLLDSHGAEGLEEAVVEALSAGTDHVAAVRQILERNRRVRGLPPAIPIPLPDDPKIRGLRVRPHSLKSYDRLGKRPQGEHHEAQL